MPAFHDLRQNIEADIDRYTEMTLPPLSVEWRQLGQELVALEYVLTEPLSGQKRTSTEQEQLEKRVHVRNAVLAQLYRDEEAYPPAIRYLAFLVVKKGRGGAIVGNPYMVEREGNTQELPYTGLEGYYAGSEQTAERPGITCEVIIQEEADGAATLLKSLKKHAVEQGTWAEFAHLKRVLAGEAAPSEKNLQTLEVWWSMILSHFHVRIYRNPEFESTTTETIAQMNQFMSSLPKRTVEEKRLQEFVEAECARLRQEYQHMGEAEQEQERQERRRRERIRVVRLEEFHRFRETTYELVKASGKGRYAVEVQDTSYQNAAITETIVLPDIPERGRYSPVGVHLTPEQLEGYLFLAQLGEIGGDPLARSMLVSR